MTKIIIVSLLFITSINYSQEYLGLNQSNHSGAFGLDFNPANIVDNRMKLDVFVVGPK